MHTALQQRESSGVAGLFLLSRYSLGLSIGYLRPTAATVIPAYMERYLCIYIYRDMNGGWAEEDRS